MKKVCILLIVFLLGVGVGFLQNPRICVAQAPNEIRIGVTAPLTGPAAENGIGLKEGMILAVEEWNAKGGIYIKEAGKNLPIKILIEDEQSKPEIGVAQAEKLITRDKVHVLLGDALHSSVTLAIMELAPKYGIPIMSVEAVSSEIAKKVATNPDRYWSYWKGLFNSEAYGKSIFYTYKSFLDKGLFKAKNKSIAFIAEDTDYGRSNSQKTSELFTGIGWKTLTLETVPLGYTDFYPQLTKIKAMNPDILAVVFSNLSSGTAYTKQFQEVGMKCGHFGIYFPLRPEFIPQVGKAGDYLLWTPHLIDPTRIPSHRAFAEKVKKRWNVPVNTDHAWGYDAVNNMCDSIKKAGSLDPKAIVGTLSKLDNKGILARYVFDQKDHTIIDGEDFHPVPAAQIQNGKHVMVWPPALAVGTYQQPPWIKD